MHDHMQYDPIEGQGHEPLKFENPTIFKPYLLCHLQHRSRIRILRIFLFLKFSEFYDFFRLQKFAKKFVILQIIDV